MQRMHFRRAQPSETRELKDWIAAHHYLQSCPPGFVHLYEFTEGKDLIGGMLIGRPSAKQYDSDKILQLHRMFFVDETAHCVESQGLAMMRRFVRVWIPADSRPSVLFRPERGARRHRVRSRHVVPARTDR